MKENKYLNIATKSAYDELLKSGMFYELFPLLSGDYESDKLIILDCILEHKITVIKIIKHFISGNCSHNIILYGPINSFTIEEINSITEEWCENNPSGHNYGYSYDWNYVTDITEINTILRDNCIRLENEKYDIERKINLLTELYDSL